MALVTGTPLGTNIAQEALTLESAPNIYFADVNCPYGNGNPDSDGFYISLSGTVTYPVYQLGCYSGLTFGDNIEVNNIRCDNVGDSDIVMKRNHMEVQFTLTSFLPFSILSKIMNGGTVTQNLSQHTEKFGLGVINNSQYWKVYMPKVYDEVAGDFVSFTGHRCKFVSNSQIAMTYAQAWSLQVTIWLLADQTKPSAQQFCTVLRSDASVIV